MAMALCVSCKKDDDTSDSGGGNGGGGNTGGGGGSQTVEMRISKMSINDVNYREESTDGGQTWNVIKEWNRSETYFFTWYNNLLSKLEMRFPTEASIYDFRYDNDKLSNAIWTSPENGRIDTVACYDVEYDGDDMSEVIYHDREKPGHYYDVVYHFEYSNGKLSSVTSVKNKSVRNYFWNGDNLSEIRCPYDGAVVSFLTYDDKNNPFYGIDAFLPISLDHGVYMDNWKCRFACLGLSKNNCTKCDDLIEGRYPYTETDDFTYNGKNYPTQAVVNTIWYHSDVERTRTVETITYEYLD